MEDQEGVSDSHSAMSCSLRPHGLEPTRLLCPWNSPGKNIGVGCHFLLQSRERGYIKLWLICTVIWQKPIQHYKAIILQLKKKNMHRYHVHYTFRQKRALVSYSLHTTSWSFDFSSSMDKPNVIQWDSVKTFRNERKRRPQRIWKKEARYPLGLHSPFE